MCDYYSLPELHPDSRRLQEQLKLALREESEEDLLPQVRRNVFPTGPFVFAIRRGHHWLLPTQLFTFF